MMSEIHHGKVPLKVVGLHFQWAGAGMYDHHARSLVQLH